MREAMDQGVSHVIFGALFLTDLREYREANLGKIGMQAVFPLWMQNTRQLARWMIDSGVVAHLVCVDPTRLDTTESR